MSQDQDIHAQAKLLLPEICAMRKDDHDTWQDAQKTDWILQLLGQQNAPVHFSNSRRKRKFVYVTYLAPRRVSWFHKTYYAIDGKTAKFQRCSCPGEGGKCITEPVKQNMSAWGNTLCYVSNSYSVALPFKSLAEGLGRSYAKGTPRALIFKSEQTG